MKKKFRRELTLPEMELRIEVMGLWPATKRIEAAFRHFPELRNREEYSHYELAEFIGMARETTSRALKKLRRNI